MVSRFHEIRVLVESIDWKLFLIAIVLFVFVVGGFVGFASGVWGPYPRATKGLHIGYFTKV
jgi:hypothetical protein